MTWSVAAKSNSMEGAYYEDAGSVKDFRSKPQSQTLYARKSARAEDSMTFVRRRVNPMAVRNRKAVNATPRSVDDSGDDAAAGYACKSNQHQYTNCSKRGS